MNHHDTTIPNALQLLEVVNARLRHTRGELTDTLSDLLPDPGARQALATIMANLLRIEDAIQNLLDSLRRFHLRTKP